MGGITPYLFLVVSFASVFEVIHIKNTYLIYPENICAQQKVRIILYNVFGNVGPNHEMLAAALRQNKLQPQLSDDFQFPCDVSSGRSPKVPTNVHQLRPGDIDVIATIGDSLASAMGVLSTEVLHIITENRGVSFLGGGQGDWRQILTLPNIIKMFNPNLTGYATEDCLATDERSQLNVAIAGSKSSDLQYMWDLLLNKIKSHPKVDLMNHWKLINIMIGPNDICGGCLDDSYQNAAENHKQNLIQVLRAIRDNLPRTLVSISHPPYMEPLIHIERRQLFQRVAARNVCPCLLTAKYEDKRESSLGIYPRWYSVEQEVSKYPEFKREDFAIVIQPFFTNITLVKTADGNTDLSYFAIDTIHLSQKSQAMMATRLWNNMLEPVENKSKDVKLEIKSDFGTLSCPTKDRPYISTLYN